jgi:hypothetical protein
VINTYDFDGVIYLGSGLVGLNPRKQDIIVTGRSIYEQEEVRNILSARGIFNHVYFNPIQKSLRTREQSGIHKANIFKHLIEDLHINHGVHFEDDEVQIDAIMKTYPVKIIHLKHEFTTK